MVPGPRLDDHQRAQLLEWLAAEYSVRLIRHWIRERGWPDISEQAVHYHKQQFAEEIATKRKERRSSALTTGLARQDERVERLKEHADALEEIKWDADEKGKLHNEKAWRETLDDIAKETGGRRVGVDHRHRFGEMSDAELDEYIAAGHRALREGGGSLPDGAAADAPDGGSAAGSG